MHNKMLKAEFKALTGDGIEPGTFSAVVAVFGNVDKVGDRISDNAFDATLADWQSKGDPIPIVLAHDWNNPFAHIGYAMPDKVKAVPGVGLVVEEGHIDLDNPTGAQVHRLMERRTLKEFSVGYTVPRGGQKKAQDGAFDLNAMNLIEFGPCLRGINDQTQLLAVKAQLAADDRALTIEERVSNLEALMSKSLGLEEETEEAPEIEAKSEEETPVEETEVEVKAEESSKEDEGLKSMPLSEIDRMFTTMQMEDQLSVAERDTENAKVLAKSDQKDDLLRRLEDGENSLI